MINLFTPPANQGQMIEVSYGWSEGVLYQRRFDHTDRSARWYRAPEDEASAIAESWHPVNSAPPITHWTPCDAPGDRQS
jgi:hypothetical protein